MVRKETRQSTEDRLSEDVLARWEHDFASGVSSIQILEALRDTPYEMGEATLRKWVQAGLLPRSVRVGRKGKHQGSQGLYPATVLRKIKLVRDMMNQGFTVEEIQRDVLFARGEIESVERDLCRAIELLDKAVHERAADHMRPYLQSELDLVRDLADQVVQKLTDTEERLIAQTQLRKTAVGA